MTSKRRLCAWFQRNTDRPFQTFPLATLSVCQVSLSNSHGQIAVRPYSTNWPLMPLDIQPETIHPALWRTSQLARSGPRYVETGFIALNRQLPGGGWRTSSLTERFCRVAGQVAEFFRNGTVPLKLGGPFLSLQKIGRRTTWHRRR